MEDFTMEDFTTVANYNKNFSTKIIKDKSGNLYALIDFGGNEIEIRNKEGVKLEWSKYNEIVDLVEKYKKEKEESEDKKIKDAEIIKYLVYIDTPLLRKYRHGYEIKELKKIDGVFYEQQDDKWISKNSLYEEIICKSTAEIEEKLIKLNNVFEEEAAKRECFMGIYRNNLEIAKDIFSSYIIKLKKEV